MTTDYGKKTNADLVELLKSRGLTHTGKKADLVARLQEDDEKKAAPANKTESAEDIIDWDDDVPAESTPAKPAPDAGANAAGSNGADAEAEPKPEANGPAADESKVEAPADTASSSQTETAGPTEAEKKPAVDFTTGLPATELEEELKKRKRRAEKFGIVEDDDTALKEAEKKLQRANRFGTGAEGETKVGVKGLDEALSTETSRKRARHDQGGRGGKRRDNRHRNRRDDRNQNRNRGGGKNEQSGKTEQSGQKNWSEKDAQAMEARKKRFATNA